ncbi:MAG: carbohydrate kinase [Candidatus Izemoplasmatales bacterium]|nr:carbohydrate kinase [Candidatus Izemoplasmatales bacterium]
MSKIVYAMGELVMDLFPVKAKIDLSDQTSYLMQPGGAPGNVCVAVSKLGEKSSFIGLVGNDLFGKVMIDTLHSYGVDTTHLHTTDHGKTMIAKVETLEDGERIFTFVRNPSADQLLSVHHLKGVDFSNSIFHFGSVALSTPSSMLAHELAIVQAKSQGSMVSFDVNLRLSLFEDVDAYFQLVKLFLNKADIVKLSEEEMAILFPDLTETKVMESLLERGIQVVLLTKGKEGSSVYTKNFVVHQDSIPVKAMDTTGAGDGFMGAILALLATSSSPLHEEEATWKQYLQVANVVGAITTTVQGAMNAYPTMEQVQTRINESK